MDDIIRLENRYYILTSSPRVDDRTCVLKHEDTFGVFDRFGDIQPLGRGDQGLYHKGTRFLSLLQLTLCDSRPSLLGSSFNESNLILNSDMTNADIQECSDLRIPHGALHIFRSQFISEGKLCCRIRVTNLSMQAYKIPASLKLAADFNDIFEVRGQPRARRGRMIDPVLTASELIFAYEGLDQVTRRTRIHCSSQPASLSASQIDFTMELAPKAESNFCYSVSCEIGSAQRAIVAYDDHYSDALAQMERLRQAEPRIHTNNEQFNKWLHRSFSDLRTMIAHTSMGLYPHAGIPWFGTVFGRDGIITALEMLWLYPDLARGVLSLLAAKQATELIPDQDAEPGKILHEMRDGEMAALKEIPFGLYYGSVDSTPLFVILAAAYFERTADVEFLQKLWPHIERALYWIDRYGDFDGDGFVEYFRQSDKGLQQQGWKDSHDSVFHADGRLAEGPIALCEVQGYVYLAKQRAAHLADVLQHSARAHVLRQEANQLQKHFEKNFWCEELGTYALALDGDKQPCRVRSSNAGHCLFAGIASETRAAQVAETLLSEGSYSGWGIRTLDAREVRYNPMSYHNGSVWPHDNALIAAGFWKYGLRDHTLTVLKGLFELSKNVELYRLPELICGFHRRTHEAPTIYPSACAPQAWASGAPFLLLSNILGFSAHAEQPRLVHPLLPYDFTEISLHHLSFRQTYWNIQVQGTRDAVDIRVQREAEASGVSLRD